MSMIGEFGLCQRKTYENFVRLLKEHSLNELEAAVNNIQKELEETSALCRNRHSADYTEVKTMPKNYMKYRKYQGFSKKLRHSF